MHTKQRFLDRIWKRVYRNALLCTCPTCKDVEENWLVIHNELHANYLYNVYCDYNCENTFIDYQDNATIHQDSTK